MKTLSSRKTKIKNKLEQKEKNNEIIDPYFND